MSSGQVLRRAAAGSALPFSPDQVAGLKLWGKADALPVIADGATQSTWLDSGPDGRTLTADSTPQYKVAANGINGLPVVRMNGFTQGFYYNPGSVWLSGAALTAFMVIRQLASGSSNEGRLFSFSNAAGSPDSNGTDRTMLSTPNGSGVGPYALRSYFSSGAHDGAASLLASTAYVVAIRFDGASAQMYRDGSADGASYAAASNFSVQRLGVGKQHPPGDTTNNFKGDIGEFLLYQAALTVPQMTSMFSYLRTRWGTA